MFFCDLCVTWMVHFQGQGHMRKNDNFTYFNLFILCMWLQFINKVKVTHQDQGHIKIKVKISSSLPTLCTILLILTYYSSVCGYRSLIRSRSHIKVKVKKCIRSLQCYELTLPLTSAVPGHWCRNRFLTMITFGIRLLVARRSTLLVKSQFIFLPKILRIFIVWGELDNFGSIK